MAYITAYRGMYIQSDIRPEADQPYPGWVQAFSPTRVCFTLSLSTQKIPPSPNILFSCLTYTLNLSKETVIIL